MREWLTQNLGVDPADPTSVILPPHAAAAGANFFPARGVREAVRARFPQSFAANVEWVEPREPVTRSAAPTLHSTCSRQLRFAARRLRAPSQAYSPAASTQSTMSSSSILKTGESAPSETTQPRAVAEIITQDEYTHDVVVGYDERVYLVFDTT